jgi:hypothetical protein
MFVTTKLILDAFYKDEFVLVIIYGPLRYGKSSLAFQILAEVYKTWDLNVLRQYIGFHPKDVLSSWMKLSGQKRKAYVWDDAGLWLHALDWNSPFVKQVGKYLNVGGTDWGGLILTAPLPTWISRKIRGIPQAITLKVVKTFATGSSQEHLRKATAYRWWLAPDMKHTGVHKIFEEHFSCMLPQPFYDWYKPYRDQFAVQAKQLMALELQTLPTIKDNGKQENGLAKLTVPQ